MNFDDAVEFKKMSSFWGFKAQYFSAGIDEMKKGIKTIDIHEYSPNDP